MNSRQLEAFSAVARVGTVTAAADGLHISQPAVSRLLAHLESRVGFALFDRVRGRLRLTPEGSAFLREVEQHFVGLASLEASARRIAAHGPGSLRVLGIPSAASGVLPSVVARLSREHPDAFVVLDTDTSDRIPPRVASGAYDLGFTTFGGAHADLLDKQVVATRPWVCVFPPGHALAAPGLAATGSLPVSALAGESLVGFSPGMSLREQVDRLLHDSGLEPRTYPVCAQTIESICRLVAAGAGAAVIHPFATHVARTHGLSVAPLDPPATLDLLAVTPIASGVSTLATRCVDLVRAAFGE